MEIEKGAIRSDIPINPNLDIEWDAGKAITRIKEWASDEDGNIDFAKYKKAFFWVEPDNSQKQGGYKLPYASVFNGDLQAVWRGVSTGMAALLGARGGVKIPDEDRKPVYNQIKKYYKKFDKEPPEFKASMKEQKQNFNLSIVPEKIKELGHGVIEVIVSTGSKDRHGEKINVAGIITKHYNGIVLYGHDYDGLPIGKTLSLKKKDGELRAKMQFAIEENPFAHTVYKLVKGGYLRDVSIGGLIDEWNEDDDIVEKLEMVEFSIVPIGANRDAQVVAAGMKSLGKSVDDVKMEYVTAMQKSIKNKIEKMEIDDIEDSIIAIEKLLAVLKGTYKSYKASLKEKATPDVEKEKRVKLITLKKTSAQVDRQAESVIKSVKLKLKRKEK